MKMVRWRRWFALLIGGLWCRGWAPALVILAILVTALAYQAPLAGSESLAANPSPVRLAGVHRPEAAPHGFQRWTTGQARKVLPGVGAGPVIVRLRFFGGADAGAGRSLRLATPTQTLLETPIRPYWQKLHFLAPEDAADRVHGDLTLLLTIPTFVLPPDERALGVSLDRIVVRSATAGILMPPPLRVGQVVLVLLLSLWILRLSGLSVSQAAPAVLGLLAFFGLSIAGWPNGSLETRMQVALGLPVLLQVLSMTLVLALGLRLAGPVVIPAAMSAPAATMLRLAVLLIFTLRLAGMLHPLFIPIDHGLRANQLLMLAAGQEQQVRERLEQQYEWGTREPVPYSLLTYYMLLPLTAVWNTRVTLMVAVKVVTSLLEATLPLLMAALLRNGPQRWLGAGWGGLVYAALPVGYLFFHDGSFPTTIGVWITLAALIAVQELIVGRWPDRAPERIGVVWRGGLATVGLALAIGAYVTHIAFVPFVGVGLSLSLALLGGPAGRARWRLALLSVTLGLLLAWVSVYGSYTLILIQRTIPSYLALIASEGSVGRNAALFFGTPINSFGQHLIAHFRVWPALLASVTLLGLLSAWRERFITHLGLSYAALFLITSLAERWFGLWNKHIVFVALAVALLAGVGLAWLWRRRRGGRVVSVTLLVYLFWESLVAWGNRVLWYHIPPGAL